MYLKYVDRLRGRDHFPVGQGRGIAHDRVRGYYIDLTRKAVAEPLAAALEATSLHVVTCQWGLGCYERYLAGEGDHWLDWALRIGRFLVERQERDGPVAGAWRHPRPFPHTFRLPGGWISGMAQGEGASLLVRLYLESGDGSFAEAALRALPVMSRGVEAGGVGRLLRGGPLPEEYPTEPASHVLNGAIFAAWGYHDVALGLGEAGAREHFDAIACTIADNLALWDLGFWSRYDLFPYRIHNVAAPWYHRLHVQQLDILHGMTARAEFAEVADRWRGYARSRWNLGRAMVHKVAFRVAVPL